MPPYLGQSVETVTAFLRKVDLTRFGDPFCLEDILAYVDSLSPGDSAAKAAVDIALHDLVGKLLGAPWYRIWGLDPSKAPYTTFTIGIDTPEVVREKTRECADRFNILKVKVGLENHRLANRRGCQPGLEGQVEGIGRDILAEGKRHCDGRAAYAQGKT